MSVDPVPFLPRRFVPIILGLALCSVLSTDAASAVEFPQSSQQWLNSTPFSMKQVAGKAVLLYFFNEQDPDCLARWKEMFEIAEQHKDQPVLFIAVNSGGQKEVIENYVQQVRLTWPVLLDTDNSFAKKFPITEIGPENGMQVAVINANGAIGPGSWQQPADTIKDILKYAKWNIEPNSVPESLRPTWFQIEFQHYTAAAPALKKALKASKEELKSGAQTLLDYVTPLIAEKAAAADAAYDAGEKWPAYRGYAELAEQFKGYELPSNVESRKKELQSDPGVKTELTAMKAFDAAKKLTGSASQKKKGMAALRKLIKDKPDTEAAQKAQELIDELEK
jgi:thiol-disulfide isomerase/thioredoxin